MKNYRKNMKNTLWFLFLSRMQLSLCAKYFPTSNQLMFQLLKGCENSRVRLYRNKKKSIVSQMITKIINDRVISSSFFKIVKIYLNYNVSHQPFSFNLHS